MYEITPPCYAINTCILYRLCFKQHGLHKKDLIGYTHANLRHATAFGCQLISRFKFDDTRIIRTGASDLKPFVGGVCQSQSIDI